MRVLHYRTILQNGAHKRTKQVFFIDDSIQKSFDNHRTTTKRFESQATYMFYVSIRVKVEAKLETYVHDTVDSVARNITNHT